MIFTYKFVLFFIVFISFIFYLYLNKHLSMLDKSIFIDFKKWLFFFFFLINLL